MYSVYSHDGEHLAMFKNSDDGTVTFGTQGRETIEISDEEAQQMMRNGLEKYQIVDGQIKPVANND
jgi:hypothetical protein